MPRPVELVAHDPRWAAVAISEAARLAGAARPIAIAIHHIGSTAVEGLAAKPVIDLLAVAASLADLDAVQSAWQILGYVSRGENGIAGRRYFTLNECESGLRKVHLHGYPADHPALHRHLAFRDLLRSQPQLAAAYAREKQRCAALHRSDSAAYEACKAPWVERAVAEAMDSATFPDAD